MLWQHEIDTRKGLVRACVTGRITDADLIECSELLRNDPEFDPAYCLLLDMTEADGSAITADGVRALASQPLLFSASARRALVVRSDLGFGMSRMFEMLRESKPDEIRVFRSLEAAGDWLDRD